jgi:hypothetical protein
MSNRGQLGPLAAALVLGGCTPHAESVLDPAAAPPPLSRVAIAPTDEALTFARVGRRVLAVTRYEDGRVEGIVSGTPDGTIFRAIGTGQKIRGLGAWLLGGLRRPLPDHVIDAYIRDARDAGIYLQPGDRVAIHVERLGVIENEVIP